MKIIAIQSDYTILTKYAECADYPDINVGEQVIVEDSNGQHLVTVTLDNALTNKPCEFKFVRLANKQDLDFQSLNEAKIVKAKKLCNAFIDELKLDMRLKKVYVNVDASKIIFYFTASGRIDFRELVKKLASSFSQTRIEMRQINEREEVALLGGMGPCGRPCCCASFLDDFGEVSIKMAKNQNIALNPSKVNGYCGKLLCCLGYENEDYVMALKIMPKIGQVVNLPDGEKGVVHFNHLIKKTVRVEVVIDDTKILKDYTLEELANCNDDIPKGFEVSDCPKQKGLLFR